MDRNLFAYIAFLVLSSRSSCIIIHLSSKRLVGLNLRKTHPKNAQQIKNESALFLIVYAAAMTTRRFFQHFLMQSEGDFRL